MRRLGRIIVSLGIIVGGLGVVGAPAQAGSRPGAAPVVLPPPVVLGPATGTVVHLGNRLRLRWRAVRGAAMYSVLFEEPLPGHPDVYNQLSHSVMGTELVLKPGKVPGSKTALTWWSVASIVRDPTGGYFVGPYSHHRSFWVVGAAAP